MLGKQRQDRDLFCYVQPENMVPQDHILRKIKDEIDFSFIDKLAEPLYSNRGRPSGISADAANWLSLWD